MNRRGFLLGAGAVVLAGGAAAATELALRPSDHRELVRPSARATTSPAGHVRPSGPVELHGHIDSRYTHARMGWTIWVPAKSHRPLAIVYCLHGKGGNHRMAFDSVPLPPIAARLGLPLVIAAVDGGPDSYWHRRTGGSDAMAMLLKEFVPLVRARVGPLPQALLGWSMGGYGALLAAERAPRRFKAVTPASPALWLTPGATAPGAFDSAADFYANDVFTGAGKLRSLTVALYCGTSDPFYLATRQLDGSMGFRHQARYGPGGHDDAYWRSVAPAQLRTIAAAPGIARLFKSTLLNMTSADPPADPATIVDAATMRALAHPLKWALMDVLLTEGAATSTRCAWLVGDSQSNCSFHLRQLARYGLVEEAPTASKKERPWRLSTVEQSWSLMQPDEERAQAVSELERVFVQHELAKLMRWERTAAAYGDDWRRAAMRSAATTWLTPQELAGLHSQIEELMMSYADRLTDPALRPVGSRPVRLFSAAYPLPEGGRELPG